MEWELLIYRLPTQPSRARVAVWRELRRLGALPLQQGAVVLPAIDRFQLGLSEIEQRIETEGGTSYRFTLTGLQDGQDERLRSEWSALREQEYAEIIEECETKFAKEVEFEIFRRNFTAAEAEEIEADLEKIKTWYARVRDRDLFDAGNRREADRAIAHCGRLLDGFLERVYRAEQIEGGPVLQPPIDIPWGEIGDEAAAAEDVVPLDEKRQRAKPSRNRASARQRRGGTA